MFGKKTRLSPLAMRKQILIAESELNRAQMIQEWQLVAGKIRSLRDRALSLGAVASSTAVLVAALTHVRHDKRTSTETKPSWLKTVLKLLGLGSTVWMAIRSHRRSEKSILA